MVSAIPDRLRAELTDDAGFRCFLELNVDPGFGGLDWTQVEDLTGLFPLPESGDPQLFKAEIEAVVDGQRQGVVLWGRSCYPMLVCPTKEPGGLEHVGAFLAELVAAAWLARPASTLRGGETQAFAAMVGLAAPPPALRIVSSAEPGAAAELRAVIHPGDRLETQVEIRGPLAKTRSPCPSSGSASFAGPARS